MKGSSDTEATLRQSAISRCLSFDFVTLGKVGFANEKRQDYNAMLTIKKEFVYLGALLDKEGGTTKDIQHRLSKARQAFHRMRRIWGTS